MKLFRTTKEHSIYWKNRKIDWSKDYLSTWNHPHRRLIAEVLKTFNWLSLIEIGCGGGANLAYIVKNIPGRQVGGIDINPDAIELCQKTFKGGIFKVNSADDIMLSDKSTDVVLSDMTLIYVGPRKIGDYIREIKRITRNHVLLCEFHTTNWWNKLALKMNSGYNSYNWPKLLRKYGFYDIVIYKIPPEGWPGGDPQKTFGYIIRATVPKI